MGAKKANSTSWQKGQSGNLAGKPKLPPEYKAFVSSLQAYSPKAVDYIKAALESSDITLGEALNYIKLLLAYAWGNPVQVIDATIEGEMVHFVARMPLTQNETQQWVNESKSLSGSHNPVLKLPT